MSQSKNKKNLRHHRKRKNWPIILFFGGGLLLLTGAIFPIIKPFHPKAAIEVIGSPGLRVNQEQVNLGNVKLGRTVEVSFELTNVGDQPLRFTDAPYVEVLEGC